MKDKIALGLATLMVAGSCLYAFANDRIQEQTRVLMTNANAIVESVKINTETYNRFTKYASGAMEWGSGSATPDVALSRSSTGVIDVSTGSLAIGGVTLYTKGLQNPGVDAFQICGDATTINNNTVYYGPDTTLTANTVNGLKCDIAAAGNTTEATADTPILTNQAFYVTGMSCRNQADQDADISYTLRTAAGATAPSVTCTIADGERDCVADVQTTTAIAAGATVAVAAASSSNVGASKGFVCKIDIRY